MDDDSVPARRPSVTGLSAALPRRLAEKVPRDHRESPAAVRMRRRVVAATVLTGAGLSTRPGSPQFSGLTLATAGTWAAGGLASGRLHLGCAVGRDDTLRRPVV